MACPTYLVTAERGYRIDTAGDVVCQLAEHLERGCCVRPDPEIAAWLSEQGERLRNEGRRLLRESSIQRQAELS